MMITPSGDRSMHARRMASTEFGYDGELYFATSLDSAKLWDISIDPEMTLILQDGSVYVSLRGITQLSTYPELVDRLWSEEWKVWFPDEKDDPTLVIMKVDPTDAKYWNNSELHGVGYAMTAFKAYITGNRPSETSTAQHAKIAL